MIVKIDVTAEDIEIGVPGETCACAVWIAVVRALPHLEYAGVCARTVQLARHLTDDGSTLPLPLAVQGTVSQMDSGLPVEPFSFELDVPDELVRPAGPIGDVREGDLFDWHGVSATVTRVAADCTWADISCERSGTTWTKRQPLPLADGFVRVKDGPL